MRNHSLFLFCFEILALCLLCQQKEMVSFLPPSPVTLFWLCSGQGYLSSPPEKVRDKILKEI